MAVVKEWWQGALLALAAASSFAYAVHRWNEHYRSRGETHPITAFLASRMAQGEAGLRARRVRGHAFHLRRARDNLAVLDEYFPGERSRGFSYDFAALDRELARLDAEEGGH